MSIHPQKDEFKISAVEEFKADAIQIIKTNKDLFADTDTWWFCL